MVQNTVLFPLGLTRHLTPAASLTPGDLLARLGPAERFGYFIYPLGLAGWLLLTRRQPGAADAGRQTPTREGGT
jgi:hypothetical protein